MVILKTLFQFLINNGMLLLTMNKKFLVFLILFLAISSNTLYAQEAIIVTSVSYSYDAAGNRIIAFTSPGYIEAEPVASILDTKLQRIDEYELLPILRDFKRVIDYNLCLGRSHESGGPAHRPRRGAGTGQFLLEAHRQPPRRAAERL